MCSMKYYTRDVSDGSGLSSQNVFLLVKNTLLQSFTRIDNNLEVLLAKVFPKETENRTSQQQGGVSSDLEQWSGSCIAIGNKYISTSNHVVEDAKSLMIQIPSISKDAEYEVEVIATDTYNDLAILKVRDSKGLETCHMVVN